MHAVSVGEVLSCVEFVTRLRAEFPHVGLFVSTATLAGRSTAGKKLAASVDGIFYAPVDYAFAVRRVLRTLQPSVVVIAETEIWPNLLDGIAQHGIPAALVNARMSVRSHRRWSLAPRTIARLLSTFELCLAQTEMEAARLGELGARDVRYPAEGQSLTLTHDGRADQAIAQVAWPGPDYHSNPREARAFRLLREMVWTELLERLRAQGKAYTLALYPGAEHGLTLYELNDKGERLSTRFAPGYFQMMADFIRDGRIGERYGDAQITASVGHRP